MKKIKVMHVVQGLDVGGLETLVSESSRYIDRERFDFVICSLSDRGILAKNLEQDGTQVIYLNKRHGFDPGVGLQIGKLIKERMVDVLHTHNQRPQIYGAMAAGLSKVSFVVHTKHGRNDPDNTKSAVLSRICTYFTDRVVVVSEDIYKFCLNREKLPAHKLVVIKNGVDVDIFSGSNRKDDNLLRSQGFGVNDKIIGTVGRISKIKNQKMLLEVFCGLVHKKFDYKLVIVGDGPLLGELEQQSRALGIRDHVVFTGSRYDIPELMRIMDIFVLSSESEGNSLVLLEAMATGLPIVATDVGGNPELIKDGENGFLVGINDHDAFSRAIEKIISDKDLYQRMTVSNRRKAESEYDIKKMWHQYEVLYELGVKKVVNK